MPFVTKALPIPFIETEISWEFKVKIIGQIFTHRIQHFRFLSVAELRKFPQQ